MTKWKAGDWAMVQVNRFDDDGNIWVSGNRFFSSGQFHPLPPSLTPEAAAVLEAAVRWCDAAASGHGASLMHVTDLQSITAAYIATLPQPDPVAELVRLARQYFNGPCEEGWRQQVIAALDAVEAAK